jgi:hypothetical protein
VYVASNVKSVAFELPAGAMGGAIKVATKCRLSFGRGSAYARFER